MSTQDLARELIDWADARGYAPLEHNYGRDRDQVADLAVPPGAGAGGRLPIAVLLHGGFWRAGFDRTLMNAAAAALLERGWVTWNVEYRRGAGTGASGVSLQDVQAAISMVRLIPEPIDIKRITVIGHSAGGHLALSAAASARVRLTVSLAGVTDLVGAAREQLGSGAVAEYMGTGPDTPVETYAAVSPITQLPSGARTLLVHGDWDDRVPVEQSREYERAARAAGDPCELIELAGEGHFGLIDPRSPAFTAWADRLSEG